MGHQVRFVDEGRTPTFDLLIDNAVEAECKQVAPTTQDDRSADDIWSLLDRRLRALFDRHDGVFFFHMTVPDRPERAHLVEAIDRVSAHLATGVGDASDSSGPVQYQFARAEVDFIGRGIHIDLPPWFPSWAQRFKPELSMVFDGGRPVEGRACFLAFDSRTPPKDPALVARDQLRNALRQLSGSRPAVIHVDITSALKRARLALADTTVATTIRAWLARHPEVSAVCLLTPAEGTTAVLDFHLEKNPSARHPLPAPFLGVT